MADERRARLKRELSQSRKDMTSKTPASRAKPSTSNESTKVSRSERPTAQTKVSGASTSRDSSRSTKERQSNKPIPGSSINTQPANKTSQQSSMQKSQRATGSTRTSKVEPVIADAKKRVAPTTRHQKTLAKKVTVTETLPRTKVDITVTGKTKSKTIEKSKNETRCGRSSSRLSRDRTRTRTLSPGESKLIHLAVSTVEIGPYSTDQEHASHEEQTYEDDYYESDFESDFESESSSSSSSSSSEEEPEVARAREVDDAPKEMNSLKSPTSRPLHAAVPFETPMSRSTKLNTATNINRDISEVAKPKVTFNFKQTNKNQNLIEKKTDQPIAVMNFALARQRCIRQEASKKAKLRGAELLSMIKLDTVSFTLLNLPPSKYDVLMSPYGTQAQTQTGEGRLEEESQTESICYVDHWTQHPPCPDPQTPGLQAVGPHEDKEKHAWPSLDYARLERFLNRASEMIFAVLAEEPSVNESSLTSYLGMKDFVESEIQFGTEVTELLAERPATLLYFAECCRLLTLHSTRDQDQQDLVCVWSSAQPSFPRHVLGSRASVTSICVHPEWPNFIIAGCYDGSLNMWDLQEVTFDHPVVILQDKKLKLRSPTFSTVEGGAVSHYSSVVRVLPTSGSQLLSVDESGLVLTWSLVHLPRSSQIGSTAMTYRLVRSHTMQLSVEEAVVTDAARFGDRLLVALDTGDVMSVALLVKHANRMYRANDGRSIPGDTVITVSPYGHQFLVQDGSGNMRVHQETRSLAVWTSPSHELGDSAPNTASWGATGLTCLLSGHVQLWHVPSPRPAITCSTSTDIVSLEASPFTTQIGVSTRDGKLYVVNVKSKWHPEYPDQA